MLLNISPKFERQSACLSFNCQDQRVCAEYIRRCILARVMPQTNLTKARARASVLGVSVKPSTRKHKKLDVYKDGKKVASIGDLRYSDYLLHGDKDRRKRYKARHESTRHRRGSASYFADQILWT